MMDFEKLNTTMLLLSLKSLDNKSNLSESPTIAEAQLISFHRTNEANKLTLKYQIRNMSQNKNQYNSNDVITCFSSIPVNIIIFC